MQMSPTGSRDPTLDPWLTELFVGLQDLQELRQKDGSV